MKFLIRVDAMWLLAARWEKGRLRWWWVATEASSTVIAGD
jgi:hypothetical protein